MPNTRLVPDEFVVARELDCGPCRLEPLRPERNEAGLAAWTSSIEQYVRGYGPTVGVSTSRSTRRQRLAHRRLAVRRDPLPLRFGAAVQYGCRSGFELHASYAAAPNSGWICSIWILRSSRGFMKSSYWKASSNPISRVAFKSQLK